MVLNLALLTLCLALLAYIAVWDLRAFRIPDHATLPLALAGLARLAIVFPGALQLHLAIALIAGALLLAVSAAYRRLRGIEGLGLGDIKMIAAGALWTGPATAMALSIAAGVALVITFLRMARGHQEPGDPIPFGAYLALGFGGVLIWI